MGRPWEAAAAVVPAAWSKRFWSLSGKATRGTNARLPCVVPPADRAPTTVPLAAACNF